MLKILVVTLISFLTFVSTTQAESIGPILSMLETGPYFGMDYNHVGTDWDVDSNQSAAFDLSNLETEQHKIDVRIGYVTQYKISFYGGAGISSFETSNGYRTVASPANAGLDFQISSLEDSIVPYVFGGISSLLFDGKSLKIGAFAHAGYQSTYETDARSDGQVTFVTASGTSTEPAVETFSFEPKFYGTVGLLLQTQFEGAWLYGGPLLFLNDAKATSSVRGLTTGVVSTVSATVDEEQSLGGVAGVRWQFMPKSYIDLELQKRSNLTVGLSLNKAF
jgi:hypothetical protein